MTDQPVPKEVVDPVAEASFSEAAVPQSTRRHDDPIMADASTQTIEAIDTTDTTDTTDATNTAHTTTSPENVPAPDPVDAQVFSDTDSALGTDQESYVISVRIQFLIKSMCQCLLPPG